MGIIERVASNYIYLTSGLRSLRRISPIARNPGRTWPDHVTELAVKYGDRVALISDGEQLSYRDYHRRANRYARWAMANGVRKGDCVALLMPNRAEYLAIWLGIARAGGVTALLNTNLTGDSLAHCVNIVSPKLIIVDAELADLYKGAADKVTGPAPVWSVGACDLGPRLDETIAATPDDDIPASERPALTIRDRCLYIYTSGTTGLPKAANIGHYRVQSVMNGFSAAMKATSADRMYVALPLYHTSGGVLACGVTLTVGGSVVIARKFSSTHFWDDIVRHKCTLVQYIGELCRYLLNSPPSPNERAHHLRLASGNGLRPDIWEAFQKRFAIPKILEWYAATEGNAVLLNFDGKAGAIGRIPKFLEHRFLMKVLRFDIEKEELVRGPDGRCIICAPDEVGELVSEIVDDPKVPSQRFDGYSDSAATEKKIVTNALSDGDRWFRTGDLVRRDHLGYFYFIDRIGDTFRWKGENVATSEVAEALGVYPGVKTANVYGVALPGRDGRAGMAALEVGPDFDPAGLGFFLESRLPDYARPLFLRLIAHLETTGTFKLKKGDLARDGFDPGKVDDPLFWRDPANGHYRRLDAAGHHQIVTGNVRF